MFGTIRKHQRWLWIFIIAAVIISFVIYFSPNQNAGGTPGDQVIGIMDGQPVTQQQLSDIHQQAELSGYLRFGENYRSPRAEQMGFNLRQEMMQRLFLSLRLKEYGIQVSDPAMVAWIKEYLKDPRTGVVNFGGFVQNSLQPAGFTTNQFLEFVRHEVGVQELERVIGVAGQLVTPQEAEAAFREQNETLSISLVSFVGSNYLAGITVDETKLGEFFTNRLAAYRIPERIALSYVRFGTTNFAAQAESELAARPNLNAEIEQMYQQRGAEAFRDPAGALLSKEAALTQIRDAVLQQRTLQLAAQQANEFANELYQMEPLSAANLAALAEKKQLTVETTPPFGEMERVVGLEDLNLNSLAQAVARLTPDQPFLTPMAGSRGVVVAAATDRIPSVIPPFETVRARVLNDYNTSQATEAARSAGRAFYIAATNSISQGKTFAEAATAAAVTPEEYSFSLSSPTIAGLEQVNPTQLKTAVERLAPGSVSEFIPTMEGGFVVSVRERQPVAEETVKAALNSFLAELRQQRERDAFNTWFVTEYNKSGAAEIAKRVGP